MADVRRSHRKLAKGDWDALIAAIDAIRKPSAAKPRYQDFVAIHVKAMDGAGMHTWGVHSMPGMPGRNFLPWHRWYLREFEQRLQQEDPGVTVPYWDWITDPKIPPQINRKAQLRRWRIKRDWTPGHMPDRADYNAVMRRPTFEAFQFRLENLHNEVHRAVGGDSGIGQMSTSSSPADPIFWLHHANVDRSWAGWEKKNPRKRPKNSSETLKPASMFGITVADTQKIADLGYRYS
jgi:hypothetical protein